MMPVALRNGNLPVPGALHHAEMIAAPAEIISSTNDPVTDGKVILLRFKQSFEVNPWDDCFAVWR